LAHPLDVFTVYGRRRTGVDGNGRVTTAAVTAERLANINMAQAFLTNVMLKHGGEATIDAVIVRLVKGVDDPLTNQVVHRIGQGKGWWE
jgi:hypothetical protein